MTMRLGVWTPLPHTIRAEPAMDAAIAELETPGVGGAVDRSFDFALDIVTRGERLGFETTLIAERFLGPDLESWILSTALAMKTSTIELMVAVHPGIVAPQVVAKLGASLDRISGGRLALNIVNGWWQEEFDLFANGGWLGDQDQRYRRMDEYIRVIKGMWTEDDFSFDGAFYKISGASLPIKPRRLPYPTIYAASRTGPGPDIVARECDVWFVNYVRPWRDYEDNFRDIERDMADMRARAGRYGRRLEFGISAHVISAPTMEAAEAEAAALEEYGKRDRISFVAAKALGAGLVGTPRTIAERLRRYESIGMGCCMLHYHPMREGLETFAAEVMPLLPRTSRAVRLSGLEPALRCRKRILSLFCAVYGPEWAKQKSGGPMALTLYHNDMSVCAQKVRLCLAEKDLAYEDKHFNLRASEHKTPEYLKLNPNGYVPTLVHDGFVVCESVVINEYLDDAFPTPPLKPADAKGRARMRGMTKFIDAAIFPSTGIVSLSIAFHYQCSPEAQELRAKVQPGWREQFSQVQKGTENSAFPAAIKRLDKMLADMEKALTDSGGPWLLGKDLSLADIGYAPYVTRLDHLKFLRHMIAKRPKTAAWYAAMQARKPYQDALAKWFNPKYLPLMDEKGTEAWPKVQALLAA